MTRRKKILIASVATVAGLVLGIEIFDCVSFRRYCAKTDSMRTRMDTVCTFSTQAWRGNIVDCNGNILAKSDTVYDVHLDTKLCEDSVWGKILPELSAGFAAIIRNRTAPEYFTYLAEGRAKGLRYMIIGRDLNTRTLDSLRVLPLFDLPSYKGGIIVEPKQKRVHPYGDLALRTLGYVWNNGKSDDIRVGIEGSFNSALSGMDGYGIMKDKYVRRPLGRVRHIHKATKVVEPTRGEDVPITIDIELQAVADSLLRAGIAGYEHIKGACMVVVSTNNGAVRTMVNLIRNSKGDLGEYYNVSIGYGYEPGRIIAPAIALAAAKCDSTLSLNGPDFTSAEAVDGMLERCDAHKFCDSLKTMLEGGYAFDHLELEGLADLQMVMPEDSCWDEDSFARIAGGHSIMAPAFRWIGLYTAIARGGEGIAQRLAGPVWSADGETLLNDPIMVFVPIDYNLCSKRQADAVTESLKAASAEALPGTAFDMAGMFGLSFVTRMDGNYTDSYGRRAIQSSYAGFFPADKPVFSIICMAYTEPSEDLHSAEEITSKVVREFVGSEIVAERVSRTLEY